MSIRVKATGETKDAHIILEICEGDFSGCEFYYDMVQFAEEENPDGSMNMHFDYEITNGYEPKDKAGFEQFLGDALLEIITERLYKGDAVFAGGTD